MTSVSGSSFIFSERRELPSAEWGYYPPVSRGSSLLPPSTGREEEEEREGETEAEREGERERERNLKFEFLIAYRPQAPIQVKIKFKIINLKIKYKKHEQVKDTVKPVCCVQCYIVKLV